LPDDYLEELFRFLKNDFRDFNVVLMPDFFLDRLVSLKWNLRSLSDNLAEVAQRKGGSIDGVEQTEMRGGNAVNTASALAALNVNVTPIVSTNDLGLRLIRFYLKSRKVDFSHVKVFDGASITTAIEFESKNGRVNVMLRDVGALADFGPDRLTSSDFEAIENADYVCVFNWAGTRRFGTKLASTVFRHTKLNGKGKTYYDTADPTPNKEKIKELTESVLQSKYVDFFSVNENEAICYATQLNQEVRKPTTTFEFEESAKEAARVLASHISARVDLHTTHFSATFTKKNETIVSAFKVPVSRATGAGDAWNAGNILGDANKLSDGCRLTLANAIAAFYISNPAGKHPTPKQLLKFLEKQKTKNPSRASQLI
jgi:sugar/nucleoside kinase (ribokinase family)